RGGAAVGAGPSRRTLQLLRDRGHQRVPHLRGRVCAMTTAPTARARTAIVVGGATGIGGAISAALVRDGVRVAAIYNRGAAAAEELERRVAGGGGYLRTLQADVRDERRLRDVIQEL